MSRMKQTNESLLSRMLALLLFASVIFAEIFFIAMRWIATTP
jgi:hypothetical protein